MKRSFPVVWVEFVVCGCGGFAPGPGPEGERGLRVEDCATAGCVKGLRCAVSHSSRFPDILMMMPLKIIE